MIYLDNLATTPTAPEVLDAMWPWLAQQYGNAASATHVLGWEAAEAVEAARDEVAQLIGARTSPEVIFTSGATESNNTVIRGLAEPRATGARAAHVVASAIEHSSVLAPARALADRGVRVTLVRPRRDGRLDVDAIAAAVRGDTRLVSVMLANNEVGTLQPIAAIADAVHERGALLHVDGVPALGKIDVDVEALGIDVFSMSAHKLHGPKGVGALYARADALPDGVPPLLHGGGQEFGQRAGTLPVAQIVGFGSAAALARRHWREDAAHLDALVGDLWRDLKEGLGDDVQLNGSLEQRLPGCLNFSLAAVQGDALIAATPGLALSTGSACSSRAHGSHVLRAMGLGAAREMSAIRVSIGRYNTTDEVAEAGATLVAAGRRLQCTASARLPA